MNRNRRQFTQTIIITAAVLLAVFTVRFWFPKLLGMSVPEKVSLPDDAGQRVFWQVDYVNSDRNVLTEKVIMDGFALCLTDQFSASRTVSLFLVSDHETFRITAEPARYNQICLTGTRLNNYDEYAKLFAARPIAVTDRYGFTAEFSTLNLPNGIYELCFDVRENETDAGFIHTGMLFKKQNQSFYPLPSDDIIPEKFDSREAVSEGVNGEIRHAQAFSDGSVIIEGYINADGYQYTDGQVIIEVTDEQGTGIYFQPEQHLERPVIGSDSVDFYSDAYRALIPHSAGFHGLSIIRVFLQMPDGTLFLTPADRSVVF